MLQTKFHRTDGQGPNSGTTTPWNSRKERFRSGPQKKKKRKKNTFTEELFFGVCLLTHPNEAMTQHFNERIPH
jgi:hypothetical protein